jgi:hypothetical protein
VLGPARAKARPDLGLTTFARRLKRVRNWQACCLSARVLFEAAYTFRLSSSWQSSLEDQFFILKCLHSLSPTTVATLVASSHVTLCEGFGQNPNEQMNYRYRSRNIYIPSIIYWASTSS